jgi:hypothetical protein
MYYRLVLFSKFLLMLAACVIFPLCLTAQRGSQDNNTLSASLLIEKAYRQQDRGNLNKSSELAAQAASEAKNEMINAKDSISISSAKRILAESAIIISKAIEATGADRKGGFLDSNIIWLSARIKEFRAQHSYPAFAGDLYFTLAEKYLQWAPDFLPAFTQKQASDSASKYLILAWKDYKSFNKTGSEAYGKLLNDLSKLAYKNRNFQTAEDYAIEWVLWLEQKGKNQDAAAGIWLAQCEFFNNHTDLAFKHINEGLNLSVIQKDPVAYAEGTRAYACMAYAERGTSEACVVYNILIPGLDAAATESGQAALNARLLLLAGITDLAEIDPASLDSLKATSTTLSKSITPNLSLLSSPWPEFYFRLDQCRLSLLGRDTATAKNQFSDLEKRLDFLAPQYPEVSTHDLRNELLLIKACLNLFEKKTDKALSTLKDYKNQKKHHPAFEKIQPEMMIQDRFMIREEMVNHYNLLCK